MIGASRWVNSRDVRDQPAGARRRLMSGTRRSVDSTKMFVDDVRLKPDATYAGTTRSFMHNVKLAFRSLRATPIVSIVAALSLALGIGANTAIFSLINGLLLRALPVKEPQRLALIQSFDAGTLANDTWTYPIWDQIRQRSDLFASAAAWSSNRFNLSSSGETNYVDGVWASGWYFETFG